MPAPSEPASAAAPVLPLLLENRRAFLGYLQRRVGDRAVAEDILQDAFVKVVTRPDAMPADEAIIPWFYRTLRNAVIERFRRDHTAGQALEAFARQLDAHHPPQELNTEVCACVRRLSATLKPEYAAALQAIDIDGMPVKEFAARTGLSATNAGVRIFRARNALRKRLAESCGACAEHGCLDCTCRGTATSSVVP